MHMDIGTQTANSCVVLERLLDATSVTKQRDAVFPAPEASGEHYVINNVQTIVIHNFAAFMMERVPLLTLQCVRLVIGDIAAISNVLVTVLASIITGSARNVGKVSGAQTATNSVVTLVVTVVIVTHRAAINVWTAGGVRTATTPVKATLSAQYANRILASVHNARVDCGDQRANISVQARATLNAT